MCVMGFENGPLLRTFYLGECMCQLVYPRCKWERTSNYCMKYHAFIYHLNPSRAPRRLCLHPLAGSLSSEAY